MKLIAILILAFRLSSPLFAQDEYGDEEIQNSEVPQTEEVYPTQLPAKVPAEDSENYTPPPSEDYDSNARPAIGDEEPPADYEDY